MFRRGMYRRHARSLPEEALIASRANSRNTMLVVVKMIAEGEFTPSDSRLVCYVDLIRGAYDRGNLGFVFNWAINHYGDDEQSVAIRKFIALMPDTACRDVNAFGDDIDPDDIDAIVERHLDYEYLRLEGPLGGPRDELSNRLTNRLIRLLDRVRGFYADRTMVRFGFTSRDHLADNLME